MRIETKIKSLSLREKTRMLSGDLDFWSGLKALMEDDYYHTKSFPAAGNEKLGIEPVRFIDGPRGVVVFGGATSFPVTMARGATFNPDLEERIGDALGKELRALGGNLTGAVCINLLRHPAWGRAQETYGEDTVHLGAMGAALTRGIENHATACVKHFAVNSMENARFSVNVTADARTLHEVYFPHFKDCVDAGAGSIMSAYNSLNGEWCGQNKPLLTDVLKNKWGFDGYVLTDFVFGVRDPIKAMDAGLDLEMPFRMVWGEELWRLAKKGKVSERQIDEALLRIHRTAEKPRSLASYGKDLIGAEAHKSLAREAAEQSMVLLKNDEQLLPLKPDQDIAVVGRLADIANLGDHGSSDGRPDYVVTLMDGVRNAFGNQASYLGASIDEGDIDTVSKADTVIVVVGYDYGDEGEYIVPPDMRQFSRQVPPPTTMRWLFANPVMRPVWRSMVKGLFGAMRKKSEKKLASGEVSFGRGGDRDSLSLNADDVALIKAACDLNKKVIVAVMSGSAVVMKEWSDLPSAILKTWYPGMEGGNAFADILQGKVNPSGKLPFVIPEQADHLPFFDKNATQITYDLWHGYRKLDRDRVKAHFPFGFGLSYTDFKLSDLQLMSAIVGADDTIDVTVKVTNTGAIAGAEVVQLYASVKGSAVERAEKELKAFARVALKAGEAKTVTLSFPAQKLAYFDTDADSFRLEAGTVDIAVGRHADDENALYTSIRLAEPSLL